MSRCRYRSCRSRRCCTGCAATAIRWTPIRNSLRRPFFRARSCMACAPTASGAKDRRHTPRRRREPGSFLRRPVRQHRVPGETLRASIWMEDDKLLAAAPSQRRAATTHRCCPRWNLFRPRNSLHRWTALEVPRPRTRRVEAISARPTGPGRGRRTRYGTAGRRVYCPNTGQGHIDGSHHRRGAHSRFPGRSQSMAGVVT